MILRKSTYSLMQSSIIAGVLLGFAWGAAVGSQDGVDWLMKINDAARNLNYSGVFVYVEGNRIETVRVTHRVEAGSMQQRIYALNGAPREIIRDADHVWYYVPDKKLGIHQQRHVSRQGFPELLSRGIDPLVKHYKVTLGSNGRIASRPVQQIRVIPRDDLRYGYDLWVDKESGLLLKAALLNNKRDPIEQYLFTEVEIGGEIPMHELEPVTPGKELAWYGDAQAGDTAALDSGEMLRGNWGIDDLPAGFMLTRKVRGLSPIRSKMVEHYVYSDGLATVSVFVERIEGESGSWLNGIKKMGAVHAFGREADGYQITVIGEVPARTVGLIGRSVRPQ